MTYNILVTGAGGGGSNNLINSLRKSNLKLNILGSNCDKYYASKSNADLTYAIPEASQSNYIDNINFIIEKHAIDLMMPNNDREVKAVSESREFIKCSVFLPDKDIIRICQDKFLLSRKLTENKIPTSKKININNLNDIDKAFEILPKAEKYWIYLRQGSGSRGATWVKSPDHAKWWVKMWEEMQGIRVGNFVITEFLPGRDYAFQSVWKNGKCAVMKMCERLSYYYGRNKLSGMSSTPALAKTVEDYDALDMIIKSIKAITDVPNGNFCMDLKGDKNGKMLITEFNIGRFCMITPIFDFSGEINTAEAYIKCALDIPIAFTKKLDYEEDVYLIRDLDTLPTIAKQKEIDQIENLTF